MTNQVKNRRLAAFAERSTWDPVLECHGTVIPLYPLSDEDELLEKLGLSPEDCIAFDCYWNTLDDVYFVQIHTKRYSDVRDCGIYARLQDDEAYFINVVVVVDDPHIGTQCMKDALKQAAAALTSASASKLTPSLTRLG